MKSLRPKKGRFLVYSVLCPQCGLENTWLSGQEEFDNCKRCMTSLPERWDTRYESNMSRREFEAQQWAALDGKPLVTPSTQKMKKKRKDRADAGVKDPTELKRLDEKSPDSLLEAASNWITRRAHLAPEDRQRVSELAAEQRDKFEVFLMMVGTSRVDRLLKLMNIAESIQDELFTEERILDASTKELLRMFQAITGTINESVSFIRALVNKGGDEAPKILVQQQGNTNSFNVVVDQKQVNITPARREALRKVIAGVARTVASEDLTESSDD